ncbi:MAG: DUF1800 domain-containing protein [Planctomycetota bacterium]|nr:DUF1800 domain-containing protein [Planctomycetota bacterium]
MAALAGAWLFASLGALPAVHWIAGQGAADKPWPGSGEDPEFEHLLARCAYGARPGDRDTRASVAQWIERQLAPETLDDREFDSKLRRFETWNAPTGELYEFHEKVVRRELQSVVLLGAIHSERRLRETLLELWRDHFSLSLGKGECAWLATSFERDALRPHAFGRLRELLGAVLLHPAMLWYLDGRLNRADLGTPNENYARELLELHTLGLGGGYTQRDVQALARALSGWTSRGLGESRKSKVSFDASRHDAGAKDALGFELEAGLGAEEVERVLDIVCAHPSTAHHVARKLCVRFVADDPPAELVLRVAASLRASDGDIAAALRTLLHSSEFREARGLKLKRPLHFVASALRACDARCEPDDALLERLERLGHAPYSWPTPDGYPDNAAHWRAGLLGRWRFAEEFAQGRLSSARIDAAALCTRAGGRERLARACLGRAASDAELQVFAAGDDAAALAAMLSSPGFQRC